MSQAVWIRRARVSACLAESRRGEAEHRGIAVPSGVGFAVPALAIANFLLRATRRDPNQGLLERSWVATEMKIEIRVGLMRVGKDSVTEADRTEADGACSSSLGNRFKQSRG